VARITGADIMVDALIKEKVNVIFGYPGAQIISLFDVLYDNEQIKTVVVRHEQAAAHAAEGYARATGKAGTHPPAQSTAPSDGPTEHETEPLAPSERGDMIAQGQ